MASPSGARAVAAVVTAPLTIGIRAVENAPEIVGRVRQELMLARFIGKLAVDQGRRELQRRLDGDDTAPTSVAPDTVTSDTVTSETVTPATLAPDTVAPDDAGDAPSGGGDDIPAAAELALENYDQLPAAQVVAKLAGLTPTERERIARYETAHRHRRTVLGKLGQLDP